VNIGHEGTSGNDFRLSENSRLSAKPRQGVA
jgi:hypothetical protein